MLEDYQNKVCVVTGAASGIGKALCEKLVALGAQVYALDRNKADIEGLSAFVETDLSDKGSIDAAFCALPQVIDRFFGVAGLSGARTSYWLTFTVNFIANKYMTDTYLEKRIPSGGSIAYVTSCGGLMWEKWRKEYVKVMDCKTWDEMVAFMKSVSPKDGVGVMAYTLSKRAMNYYTSLKAVELGKRGVRVNALLPDQGIENILNKQLAYMSGEAERYPAGYSMFLMALSDFWEPPLLITAVPNGEHLNDLPFVLPSDAIVKVLEHPSEEYKLLNEETTFYVCRNHSCLPPMNKRQLMTEIQKQYQT